MRRHYLDNLRWAAVVLVLLYHVCYLFNGVGIPGGLPGSESIPALDGPCTSFTPGSWRSSSSSRG